MLSKPADHGNKKEEKEEQKRTKSRNKKDGSEPYSRRKTDMETMFPELMNTYPEASQSSPNRSKNITCLKDRQTIKSGFSEALMRADIDKNIIPPAQSTEKTKLMDSKQSCLTSAEEETEESKLDYAGLPRATSPDIASCASKKTEITKDCEITPPDEVELFFRSRGNLILLGKYYELLAKNQLIETNKIIEKVRSDVTELFSRVLNAEVKVIFFGSRMSGLAYKNDSDLDMFIETNNKDSKSVVTDCRDKEIWLFNKVKNYMKTTPVPFESRHSVFSARTIVFRLKHILTNMACDIVALSKSGISNTKLITMYMKYNKFLCPTILIIREWMALCGFTGHIHHYALNLLVLFYFQVEGYCAPVHLVNFECTSLISDVSYYDIYDYDVANYSNIPVRDMSECVFQSVIEGFFRYYANFDFTSEIVCPLLGHPIRKDRFLKKRLKKLPSCMYQYVKQAFEGGEILKTDKTMCVQDPLDLSHNLIKTNKRNFDKIFQQVCHFSAEVVSRIK